MASARRIGDGERAVRAGEWRTFEPDVLLGVDVHGATLGVVGWGRIGQAVGRRAEGFGMTVLHTRETPLDELLRRSDFVSLHTPLTDETRGLIGARELALMQPHAVLVNTARGEVVDTDALVDVLNAARSAAPRWTSPIPSRCRRPPAAARARGDRRPAHRLRVHAHARGDGGHGGRQPPGRAARRSHAAPGQPWSTTVRMPPVVRPFVGAARRMFDYELTGRRPSWRTTRCSRCSPR